MPRSKAKPLPGALSAASRAEIARSIRAGADLSDPNAAPAARIADRPPLARAPPLSLIHISEPTRLALI
eukprot:7775297-Alexandrium_andersonii.AAC.1